MPLYDDVVLTERVRVQKIELKITLTDGQVRSTEQVLPLYGSWDGGQSELADLLDSLLGYPGRIARYQEGERESAEEKGGASSDSEPPKTP